SPGAATTVSFWMDWNGVRANSLITPIGFSNYALAIEANYNGDPSPHLGFLTDTGTVAGSVTDTASAASLADQWHFVTAIFVNGNALQNQLWIDGVQHSLQQQPYPGGTLSPVNVSVSGYIASYGADPRHNFGGALDDVAFFNQQLTPAQIQS